MDVPFRALLPVTAIGALYCPPRAYVIIEGFINIRTLPPKAFDSVDWTAFIPHFCRCSCWGLHWRTQDSEYRLDSTVAYVPQVS